MSIFGSIFSKIFPSAKADPVVTASAAAAPASAATAAAPAPAVAPPPSIPLGDVPAILDAMPGASRLNWRTSIVDLMKLLGLESDLATRRALADELLYSGDKSDTATMNIWLHRQVMTRLAANGGTVPPELRD
ncbi:MAG: DUF3597 domain-containing protein [Burkholderiales bacterium]|nr:DUF3597 domain-containing protein [Burkholderiales bacterium]